MTVPDPIKRLHIVLSYCWITAGYGIAIGMFIGVTIAGLTPRGSIEFLERSFWYDAPAYIGMGLGFIIGAESIRVVNYILFNKFSYMPQYKS